MRIRISNAFGTQPLAIGDAHVAIPSSSPAAIVPGSDQALTFGGEATVTIPVGSVVISDPVNFQVSALSNLAISLYLPQDTTNSTITEHTVAERISYVSPATGDFTGAFPFPPRLRFPIGSILPASRSCRSSLLSPWSLWATQSPTENPLLSTRTTGGPICWRPT